MERKLVTSLPAFPRNVLVLQRGTILQAKDDRVRGLGLQVGARIPIGFDGERVRCRSLVWDVDQIVDEIGGGVWKVIGQADLSDPARSVKFARDIEGVELTPSH